MDNQITNRIPASAVKDSTDLSDYANDPKLLREPVPDSPIQYISNNIVYTVLVVKIAEVFYDKTLHDLASRHLIGMYSTFSEDNDTAKWAHAVSKIADPILKSL